jgi:DNA-binding MarR family transcriptional regulator
MVKYQRPGKPAIPKAGEGKRGTGGYFAYLLRQAGATLRTTLDRAFADLDITSPQFSALLMIGSYPDLSSAELARLSLLTPQTVNLIVRNLEARGAITRHPHPVHGRILVLQITSEGKRLLAVCRKRADAIEARLSEAFGSEAEKEVVRRWLTFVATDLHISPTDDDL